ncbi:2786_t:CDS:2, partial [Acaulospora colombiana]
MPLEIAREAGHTVPWPRGLWLRTMILLPPIAFTRIVKITAPAASDSKPWHTGTANFDVPDETLLCDGLPQVNTVLGKDWVRARSSGLLGAGGRIGEFSAQGGTVPILDTHPEWAAELTNEVTMGVQTDGYSGLDPLQRAYFGGQVRDIEIVLVSVQDASALYPHLFQTYS